MKKTKYSGPYSAKDYFSKEILPDTVYAGRKTVRQNISYQQHEDTEFLLVRSGEATITINARSFPVSRGSLLCFSPSHFHKLEIEKGGCLEVSECHVNSGVFFYLSACPYYVTDPDHVTEPPVYAQLDEARTQQVTEIMDALEETSKKTPITDNQPTFFQLMKLFGILEKNAVSYL